MSDSKSFLSKLGDLFLGFFISLGALLILPLALVIHLVMGLKNRIIPARKRLNVNAARLHREIEKAHLNAFKSVKPPNLEDKFSDENNRCLAESVKELVSFLQKRIHKNPLVSNRKLIKMLRRVLKSESYQNLKKDPHNCLVAYLQKMSLAIWNQPQESEVYRTFGEAILCDLESDVKSQSESEVIETIIKSSEAWHPNIGTGSRLLHGLLEAADHPLDTWNYLKRENQIVGVYPFVQNTHRCKHFNKEIQIRDSFSGAPIYGNNKVCPEFLAAIQVIDNNKKLDKPDPEIPDHLFLINFQHINREGTESLSSTALMELNKEFPDSFLGITLSKDSKLYLNIFDRPWIGAEKFGAEMKTYLMGGSSHSLYGRAGVVDGGYYFPGDYRFWDKLIVEVIDLANQRFEVVPSQLALHGNQETLRGAYIEYVYALIEGYIELWLASKYKSKQPTILTVRSFRDNVDRSAAESLKHYYLSACHQLDINLMAGLLHGRPLVGRNRLIDTKRTPQVFSFMRFTNADFYQEDLNKLIEQSDSLSVSRSQ